LKLAESSDLRWFSYSVSPAIVMMTLGKADHLSVALQRLKQVVALMHTSCIIGS